jgi:transposase InsO family protein
MSDNAQEFRSATFAQTISQLGARHSFIRAGRPQTNGGVERVQQTILDECWKPAFARYLIPKQTGLRLDLDRYLHYYNTERAPLAAGPRGEPQMRSSGRPSYGRSADASPQLGDRTV